MPKTAGTKNVSDNHYIWLAQMINANFKKYYGSYNTTTNNENNKKARIELYNQFKDQFPSVSCSNFNNFERVLTRLCTNVKNFKINNGEGWTAKKKQLYSSLADIMKDYLENDVMPTGVPLNPDVENDFAMGPPTRENNGIYQRGYIDNGLDTAPVRREAESRREVTSVNTNRANSNTDNQALALNADENSSTTRNKRNRMHNTKVAANLLVDIQEKMLKQDINVDNKREKHNDRLLNVIETYCRESLKIQHLTLKLKAKQVISESEFNIDFDSLFNRASSNNEESNHTSQEQPSLSDHDSPNNESHDVVEEIENNDAEITFTSINSETVPVSEEYEYEYSEKEVPP